MFELIDDVKWEDLNQANGSADHVPGAIKDLISNEEEVRKAAYWKLDNHIVLQGDLYEAAYYAIPFLVEILNSDVLNGRNLVYDLLFEIVNGYSTEQTKVFFEGEQLDLDFACISAAWGGQSAYMKDVNRAKSSCGQEALDLLFSFNEHGKDIYRILQELRLKATDESIRNKISEMISELV